MALFDNLNHTALGAVDWLGRDRITSAYRPPTHPVEARKRQPGQHAHGNALDISIKGMTPEQILADVEGLKSQGFKRFIMYPGGTHLHADTSDAQGDFHKMYAGTGKRMHEAPQWWQDYTPGGMVDMPVSATGGASMTTPDSMGLALHAPVGMESIPAPEPSLTSRLASNPFVQMGLGLLANNQNFGEGLQTGLLAAAQGEALGQRSQQNAIANELERRRQSLYQQSNMINLGGQMGLGEASPSELLRAQTAARQQDLQASEQDLKRQMYENPAQVRGADPRVAQIAEILTDPNVPEEQKDLIRQQEGLGPYAKETGPGAREQAQGKEASTVVRQIDDLIVDIEANPEAVSPLAKPKLWLGKLIGGIADETNNPQWKAWTQQKLKTVETARISMGLANAATDAAKWVVNKGDKKMSNDDVKRADAIMNRDGFLTDSTTTLTSLRELRDLIAPYVGEETTPPLNQSAPPQAKQRGVYNPETGKLEWQ